MPFPYRLAFEQYKGKNEAFSGGYDDGIYQENESEEVLVRPPHPSLITGGGLPPLLVPGAISDASGRVIQDIAPMDYIQDWLKKRMPEYDHFSPKYEDKIMIIRAKTGSGKSSLMPVYLYRMLKKGGQGGVVNIQPKILTAQQLALEQGTSPHYPDMKYKENVGYATGNGKMRPRDRNGLTYMTTGVFLQIMRTASDQEIMKQFRFIILDEVHDRTLMLDMALLQVKTFLRRCCDNEKCPIVILTSATFDTEKYAKYMEVPMDNVVNVEGQSFPIETIWPKENVPRFVEGVVDVVKGIVTRNDDEYGKDILVFVPGDEEIRNVTYALSKLASSLPSPFLILSVSGKKVRDDHIHRRLIFEPYEKLKVNSKGEYDPKTGKGTDRRVIIATTVAETGLTIETIGSVIDYGMDRHTEIFAPYMLTGLITGPASQSKILQRKGRTGRLFPGKFFPLYTEETFLSLPVQTLPSIVIEDLDRYLLYMLRLMPLEQFVAMDMLDNPPIDSLKQTFEAMYYQGYVGLSPGFHITKLGDIISRSMTLELGPFRLIVSAYINEISVSEMITYAACFPELPRRMLDRGFNQKKIGEYMGFDYMEWKLLTMDTVLDTLVIAYMGFQIMEENMPERAMKLLEEMGIRWTSLISIIDRRLDMMNDLVRCGLDPFAFVDTNILAYRGKPRDLLSHVKKMKRSVVDAYGTRVLMYSAESDSYQTVQGLKTKLPFHYPGLDYTAYNAAKDKFGGLSRKPKYIISPNLALDNTDRERYKYEVVANHVIVLDGYVPFDMGSLLPEGYAGEQKGNEGIKGGDTNENGRKDIGGYISIIKGYHALLGQVHMLQHSVVRKGATNLGNLGPLLELH